MKTICRRILTLVMSGATATCGGTLESGEEPTGIAADAIEGFNALNPNALNPNALNPNALSPADLALDPLSPAGLAPEAMAAIQLPGPDGDRSRQLLQYMVSCAFAPTQSFDFTWTDEYAAVHQESYPGLLGLATTWIDHSLSTSGQYWVSACLASRVNWYGTSVVISSRASHPALNKSGTEEVTSYDMEEGAFWGNLFTATPQLYACHHGPNQAYARSLLRDCAAGHLETLDGGLQECGIIDIAGDCQQLCDALHPNGIYHPSCTAPGDAKNEQVISVFLE